MADKVHGGTPYGSQSLCSTCRMAHRIHGLNLQEEVVCRAYNSPMRITFPVESCSIYDDKRKPSLYMMEQVAWNITSRNRGPTGFTADGAFEIHIEPPGQQDTPHPSQIPPVTGRE